MRRSDGHFDLESWTDFVRYSLEEAARAGMQAHLDAGCDGCREIVDWLRSVVRTAAADAALNVPADVVANARSIFVPRQADPSWTERLRQLPVELVRQLAADLQPAGVRSTTFEGNRMLYRSGDYSVDLKIEAGAGESGEIVGQIVNELEQKETLEGVLVQVIASGKTLGETATNRFGEFIIAIPQGKKSTLRLALAGRDERIDIPMARTPRG